MRHAKVLLRVNGRRPSSPVTSHHALDALREVSTSPGRKRAAITVNAVHVRFWSPAGACLPASARAPQSRVAAITTIEAWRRPTGTAIQMQEAFINNGRTLQCGYCTPADVFPPPGPRRLCLEWHARDHAEIANFMSGKHMRGEAYQNIVERRK